MLMTLIVVASLLAGSAVLVSVQVTSTRGANLTKNGLSALYCAEAGLAAARAPVASNYGQWNASLGQLTEPTWLAGIDHDLDDDGTPDFIITLRDNADERPPLADDPTRDDDLAVYVISRCTKFPDNAVAVSELVRHNGGGGCYESQLGGCDANGNAN